MRINAVLTIAVIINLTIVSHRIDAMGLRSFVALPVEKGGSVVRLTLTGNDADDRLIASGAYGISARQTLLAALPYRLNSAADKQLGDASILYRHIIYQADQSAGTNRLAVLGGLVIPSQSDQDYATQAGFVWTTFKNRNEFDIDSLYQLGFDDQADSGRYDISWQYRLIPAQRAEWGIGSELNSVIEFNGRWKQSNTTTQQVTLGLQWINQKWVAEGGVIQDLNNDNLSHYILSFRFHF